MKCLITILISFFVSFVNAQPNSKGADQLITKTLKDDSTYRRKSYNQDKCDSISFYANGKIAYLRTSKGYYNSTYSWHVNGHIKSQALNNYNGYHRIENYEDGSIKFDSVSNNTANFCEYFYENGLLQKRILIHKPQSTYFATESSYSHYEFERDGQVSLIIKKDNKGKEVVNENYPFKNFKNLKYTTTFYSNKVLRQFGYYYLNAIGDTMKLGVWYNFYKNGQLAEAGLYNKGIPWGLHINYDSSGNITERKYFIGGAESDNPGLKPNSKESYFLDVYKSPDGIFKPIYSHDNKKTDYYYYKGMQLSEVPNALTGFDSTHLIRYVFPLFEYYSQTDYYEINYFKPFDLTREIQMIYGQFANKYEYNGKLKTKTFFNANNTQKYNSPIVNLDLMERKEILRDDSTSHLFVTLPCGTRIEVLDRYLAINGYWEFVADNGNKLFEGDFYNGQQGTWIEYYSKTGIPKVIQNFHLVDHTSLAKGKYKEFYSNGGKKIYGRYNGNRKKTGIWKEYTEKGEKYRRARLINNLEYGIVIKRDEGWLRKNGKMKKRIYVYWKGKRLFNKTEIRPPVPF
jgi:hypothetical protein